MGKQRISKKEELAYSLIERYYEENPYKNLIYKQAYLEKKATWWKYLLAILGGTTVGTAATAYYMNRNVVRKAKNIVDTIEPIAKTIKPIIPLVNLGVAIGTPFLAYYLVKKLINNTNQLVNPHRNLQPQIKETAYPTNPHEAKIIYMTKNPDKDKIRGVS